MLRSSLGRITSCLLVGLTLGAPAGHAAPKPEKINFDTADKVQLVGTFYGSDKGKKAPCVLMLHNIGSNRSQEGWKGLAEKLQERGVAVLMFDFRGHGDSTTVQQDFWRLKANLTLKGANPKKTEISFKDFPPSYYPMLVNDIAAAKRELDKRNDAQECNSADLLVVGAGEGAALGALWLSTEWDRRKYGRNQFGNLVARAGAPEGEDIAACIWISMTSNAGKLNMSVANWIGALKDKETVPMCFFYGADDTRAAKFSKQLEGMVARKDKNKLTFEVPLKGTKLAAQELLGKKSLNTEELIGKYVDKVLDARAGKGWEDRDTKKQVFMPVPLRKWGYSLP